MHVVLGFYAIVSELRSHPMLFFESELVRFGVLAILVSASKYLLSWYPGLIAVLPFRRSPARTPSYGVSTA